MGEAMSPTCVHGLPDPRLYYDVRHDVQVGDALSTALATNEKLRAKIAKLVAAGDELAEIVIELDGEGPYTDAWKEAKA